MLSLRTLLFKIGRECRTPKANIFGGIEKSISQISGATLFHVSITVLQLPWLICRWRESSISQQLVCACKVGKISNFSKNHCTHMSANTGDCKDGRIHLRCNLVNCGFYLRNFFVLYLYRSIRQLGMRLLITFSMLGQNAIPSMCFYGHSVLIPSSEVCGLWLQNMLVSHWERVEGWMALMLSDGEWGDSYWKQIFPHP